MGLDIVAVRQARFLHPRPEQWSDEHAEHLYIHVIGGFEARLDGKLAGCYEADDGFHFRAGSYSGYNDWRRWLSETQLGVPPQAVWDAPESFAGKPFVELVNFADSEGAIGPVTSAKLAEDFRSHQSQPDLQDPTGYYLSKWDEWARAFALAADDGFVVFR